MAFYFFKMRLDVYLKLSRLIARRTLAKKFTSAGLIKVNGAVAKSSKEMSVGDEIEITRFPRILTVQVSEVPNTKQVSKKDVTSMYKVISEQKMPDQMDFPEQGNCN